MTEDERRHILEKKKRIQQALHDWLVRGKIVSRLKHDQPLTSSKKRDIVTKKVCEVIALLAAEIKFLVK